MSPADLHAFWRRTTETLQQTPARATCYVAAHPEARQAILDSLAYFDPLHLAPSIQCPTLVNVGMCDEVCPASTILPVFERITAPKALHVYPDLTHTPCTDFNAHAMHWLRRYLGA